MLLASVWALDGATASASRIGGVVAEAGPFDVTVWWNERDSSTVGGYHVYIAKTTANYSSGARVFAMHTGKIREASVIQSIETPPKSGNFESVEVFLPGRHTDRRSIRFYNLDGDTAYKFKVVALNTSAPAVEIAASAVEVRATTGGMTLWNQWTREVDKLEQDSCVGQAYTNCPLVARAVPLGHQIDYHNSGSYIFPGGDLAKYRPLFEYRYGIKRPVQTCMNRTNNAPGGDTTISTITFTVDNTGDVKLNGVAVAPGTTYTSTGSVNPYDLTSGANPKLKTSSPKYFIRGTISVLPTGHDLSGRQFFNGPCSEAPPSNRTGSSSAGVAISKTTAPPEWFDESTAYKLSSVGVRYPVPPVGHINQAGGAIGRARGQSAPGHPIFDDYGEGDTAKLDLPENSPAGTLVGEPLAATDPDGDSLTYFLDGADASAFTIDDSTGQLSVAAGASFNRATKSSYAFTVIVMDDSDAAEMTGLSVIVTITAADDGESDQGTSTETDMTDQGTTDQVTTPDTAPTVADTSKFKTHYATVGQAFSLVLPAADADSGNGGPYTYALLNRTGGTAFSANGLSFNATTRTLSGTPTAEATHELTYRIHDSDANTASSDAFVEATKLKIVVLPGGQATGNGGPQGESNSPPQQQQQQPTPPAPSPPTASAGADFNAKRGEVITLKGSGTAHAEGSQTLTYQWTISDASDAELVTVGNKGFLTNATQAQATFTVMKKRNMTNRNVLNNGNWIEFTLTVTDGDDESHSDTVKLTIQGTTWKATVQ